MASVSCDPDRLADLLFVTSDDGVEQFGRAAIDELRDLVGDDFVRVMSPTPKNSHEAAKHVRRALGELTSIKGVVILGNYVSVPARRIMTLDAALLDELNAGESDPCRDADRWWAWSDDIYGDWDGNGVPDLPVSRLPNNPEASGIVGPSATVSPEAREAFGLRASEFPFADTVYREFIDRQEVMRQSPPDAQVAPTKDPPPGSWPTLQPGDLAATHLYLVLHGSDGGDMQLKGTTVRQWVPIAVDAPVVSGDWEWPSTIVGGICWGALIAVPMARWATPDTKVEPRTVSDSFPLAFLAHGANAFIGFTTWHYVPEWNAADLTFGARLHWNVWENITRHGLPPAHALFQAKARFIRDTDAMGNDPLVRATAMKTFWSATCLGCGW